MNKFFLIILLACFTGCSGNGGQHPKILIDTNEGEIEVELYPGKAPKTVAAFLSYVDSGFYTKSSFYRVVLAEGLSSEANTGLIQGGIYLTNEAAHPNLAGIPHEGTKQTGLSHTTGTISLARTTPGSANSEFFICVGDQTQFDEGMGSPADGLGFAAFGKVTKGMKTVRAIQSQKKNGESFLRPVQIKKITRL